MTRPSAHSVSYYDDETELIGYLVTEPGRPRPGVLLLHDAFGVSEQMKTAAQRIAGLGYSVLLADLWGAGRVPGSDEEIGSLIGAMAGDRERWAARIAAGHEALIAHPDVGAGPIVAVGYCFGGSSALEYLRHGVELEGVVSFHGGLDTVGTDWSAAGPAARVLVLTGAEDPMAPRATVEALADGLTAAGIDWEIAVYGATRHAFTNPHADRARRPDVIAYDARADRRSWDAFARFLEEINGEVGARA